MIGKKVLLGRYPGSENRTNELISWIVLDQEGSEVLLLSEKCIDAIPYNDRMLAITWEECTLRKKLNEEVIKEMFTEREQSALVEAEKQNPDNDLFHAKGGEPSNGGKATSDKLFILSPEELEKYFDTPDKRMAAATGYAKRKGIQTDADGNAAYWLRAPGMRENCAVYVTPDGVIQNTGYHVNTGDFGVRIALWVDSEVCELKICSGEDAEVESRETHGKAEENPGKVAAKGSRKKWIIFGIIGLAVIAICLVLVCGMCFNCISPIWGNTKSVHYWKKATFIGKDDNDYLFRIDMTDNEIANYIIKFSDGDAWPEETSDKLVEGAQYQIEFEITFTNEIQDGSYADSMISVE